MPRWWANEYGWTAMCAMCSEEPRGHRHACPNCWESGRRGAAALRDDRGEREGSARRRGAAALRGDRWESEGSERWDAAARCAERRGGLALSPAMGLEEVLPISLLAPRLGLVLLLNVMSHARLRVRVRAIQLNRRLDPTAEGAREPRAVSPTLSPCDGMGSEGTCQGARVQERGRESEPQASPQPSPALACLISLNQPRGG